MGAGAGVGVGVRVGVGAGVGAGEPGSSMVTVAWAPRMMALVGGMRLTVKVFDALSPGSGLTMTATDFPVEPGTKSSGIAGTAT